jgi:hypothetical protein
MVEPAPELAGAVLEQADCVLDVPGAHRLLHLGPEGLRGGAVAEVVDGLERLVVPLEVVAGVQLLPQAEPPPLPAEQVLAEVPALVEQGEQPAPLLPPELTEQARLGQGHGEPEHVGCGPEVGAKVRRPLGEQQPAQEGEVLLVGDALREGVEELGEQEAQVLLVRVGEGGVGGG